VIETDRLTLRRFREEDRDTVARWNADPEFTRYLAGVQTRAQSDAAFERWQRHWDEHRFGLLAVEWRSSGELIGRAGPQYHRMWADDPEVGWALDPAWWGRGIATEAGGALVAWSFGELGFERVVSITTEPNLASRNVMAKLGFTLHVRIPSEWGILWVHVLDRGTEQHAGAARAGRAGPGNVARGEPR
jgi:RimJ/RimL family protein N-acetyltransferase